MNGGHAIARELKGSNHGTRAWTWDSSVERTAGLRDDTPSKWSDRVHANGVFVAAKAAAREVYHV